METVITLRVTQEQKELIEEYAKMHGASVSAFILQAVLDKIEDELDLYDMEAAVMEFKADPVTFTHDEIKKELGLQ